MKPFVLIADGDPDQCRALAEHLSARGYDVDTASNGLDCLVKAVRGTKPDLLVLDLELPWGGGQSVLTWLREGMSPRGVPPVVIMTRTKVQDDLPNPPVRVLVQKPFEFEAMAEIVAETVRPGTVPVRQAVIAQGAR